MYLDNLKMQNSIWLYISPTNFKTIKLKSSATVKYIKWLCMKRKIFTSHKMKIKRIQYGQNSQNLFTWIPTLSVFKLPSNYYNPLDWFYPQIYTYLHLSKSYTCSSVSCINFRMYISCCHQDCRVSGDHFFHVVNLWNALPDCLKFCLSKLINSKWSWMRLL